ncbi:hypothetical protein EDD99_1852 [Streptomyces sp. 846.5]|nr:hypothetical protein EDD99_1852 [Streptomyces sp. 846.5]
MKIRDGATGACTANWPPSASRSPPPPCGTSSTNTASTPPRNATIDFFETRTLTGARLTVLAAIEHASRRNRIPGATAHPTAQWVTQVGRNLAMDLQDADVRVKRLIRDRDVRYPAALDALLADEGIETSVSRFTTSATRPTSVSGDCSTPQGSPSSGPSKSRPLV